MGCFKSFTHCNIIGSWGVFTENYEWFQDFFNFPYRNNHTHWQPCSSTGPICLPIFVAGHPLTIVDLKIDENRCNTSESMCTKYWLTACSSLPRKKCG